MRRLGPCSSERGSGFAVLDKYLLAEILRYLDFRSIVRTDSAITAHLNGNRIAWLESLRSLDDHAQLERFVHSCVSYNWLVMRGIPVKRVMVPFDLEESSIPSFAGPDFPTSIIALEFMSIEFTDAQLEQIVKGKSNLREVGLSENPLITDQGIGVITESCPFLEKINLASMSSLTALSLSMLATRCRRLLSICLMGLDCLTDASVTELAQKCPSLKSIDLRANSRLTGRSLISIAEHLPSLTALHICYCRGIMTNDVVTFLQSCKQLKSFESTLRSNTVVTALGRNCASLESLCLRDDDEETPPTNGCSVDEASIRILVSGCPLLKDFSMVCPCLTDASIILVATRCRNLRTIDICCAPDITDISLFSIIEHCKNLRHLTLFECSGVTDAGVQALSKCRTLCRVKIAYCDKVTEGSLRQILGLKYIEVVFLTTADNG